MSIEAGAQVFQELAEDFSGGHGGSKDPRTTPFMGDALRTFQRTLKLPFTELDHGMAQREVLDAALKSTIQAAKEFTSSFDVRLRRDEDGQLTGSLTRGPLQISINGRYVHNKSFGGNQSSSFVSYTIDAQVKCSQLEHSNEVGVHLMLVSKIGGAVVATFVLCLLMSWFFKRTGFIFYLSLLFIPIVWLGIRAGGKLGKVLAKRVENRVLRQLGPGFDEFDHLWNFLTDRLTAITWREAA
jgi:hypothetical protein